MLIIYLVIMTRENSKSISMLIIHKFIKNLKVAKIAKAQIEETGRATQAPSGAASFFAFNQAWCWFPGWQWQFSFILLRKHLLAGF